MVGAVKCNNTRVVGEGEEVLGVGGFPVCGQVTDSRIQDL